MYRRRAASWSGDLRQVQVFDRMAERPVADVVQQGGGEKQLGVVRRDGGGESLVGRQAIQVLDRRQKHAQRMFLPRMIGGRIDQAHQPQLADLREPAKRGRVDQPPHAVGERHVDARRNPHQPAAHAPAANFGDVVDRSHMVRLRIERFADCEIVLKCRFAVAISMLECRSRSATSAPSPGIAGRPATSRSSTVTAKYIAQ